MRGYAIATTTAVRHVDSTFKCFIFGFVTREKKTTTTTVDDDDDDGSSIDFDWLCARNQKSQQQKETELTRKQADFN